MFIRRTPLDDAEVIVGAVKATVAILIFGHKRTIPREEVAL